MLLNASGQVLYDAALTRARGESPVVHKGWTIYGDGKHDDTQALQAMLNGHSVWDARGGMPISKSEPWRLSDCVFAVSRQLYVTVSRMIDFNQCWFEFMPNQQSPLSSCFHIHTGGVLKLWGCQVIVAAPGADYGFTQDVLTPAHGRTPSLQMSYVDSCKFHGIHKELVRV